MFTTICKKCKHYKDFVHFQYPLNTGINIQSFPDRCGAPLVREVDLVHGDIGIVKTNINVPGFMPIFTPSEPPCSTINDGNCKHYLAKEESKSD